MAYYVTVPKWQLGRLVFPGFCPYTLEPNPKSMWELTGQEHRTQSLVVVTVAASRAFAFKIPVSRRFERRQHLLALYTVLPLLLSVALLFSSQAFGRKRAEAVAAMGLLLPLLSLFIYALKRFLRRHVWIDYVDENCVEVAFSRKDYVRAFCDLNGLQFRWKLTNFRPTKGLFGR